MWVEEDNPKPTTIDQHPVLDQRHCVSLSGVASLSSCIGPCRSNAPFGCGAEQERHGGHGGPGDSAQHTMCGSRVSSHVVRVRPNIRFERCVGTRAWCSPQQRSFHSPESQTLAIRRFSPSWRRLPSQYCLAVGTPCPFNACGGHGAGLGRYGGPRDPGNQARKLRQRTRLVLQNTPGTNAASAHARDVRQSSSRCTHQSYQRLPSITRC